MAGVALSALGGLWWRTGFPADAVDAAALCVAGVAIGDIHLHFAWQAWHLRHWARFAADSTSQCTVVLYHELILRAAADMDAALLEGVQDMQPVRAQLP